MLKKAMIFGLSTLTFDSLALSIEYDTVNGVDIAYYDSQGKGETVVFIHGNSSSSTSFQKQLDSQFGQDYRIIAVDLPGHGLSSAPKTNQGYLIPNMAKTLEMFIEKNNFDTGVVVGWSYGGHLLLQMAQDLENVKGFGIFGTPPLGSPLDIADGFLPHPASNFGYAQTLTPSQMDQYTQSFFSPNAQVPFSFKHDIRVTDGNARVGIATSIETGQLKNEREIVSGLTKPLAIIQGANEQLINSAYFNTVDMPTLWRQKVNYVYSAGHAPHYENHFEFNNYMRKFVDEVTSN